ncbi:MAG: ATP-binding protein [Candidatus Alcyoniella australis]|nr:ATP-binding protein [Candidatus Alcyoniella australis]
MRRDISGSLLSLLIETADACEVDQSRLFAAAAPDIRRYTAPHRFFAFETFEQLLSALASLADGRAAPISIGRRFMTHPQFGLGRLALPGIDQPADVIRAGVMLLEESIRPLKVASQPVGRRTHQIALKLDDRLPLTQSISAFLVGTVQGLLDMIDARRKRMELLDLQLAVEQHRPAPHISFEIGAGNGLFKLIHNPKDPEGPVVERHQLGQLSSDGSFVLNGVRYGAPRSLIQLSFRPRTRRLIQHACSASPVKGGPDMRQMIRENRDALLSMGRRSADLERRVEGFSRITETVNMFINQIKAVPSLSELIQLLATATCGPFGFDRSLIFLVSDDMLNIVSSHNPSDSEWAQVCYSSLQASPIRLVKGLYEFDVLDDGRPRAVNNASQDQQVPLVLKNSWNSSSYALVPIRGRERSMGLLLVDHYYKRREINEDDLDILNSVSNISGLALDKLLVIGSLEEKVDERTRALSSANKKLTQLYQRAKESEHLKSMFLANVSHELRTPLNSIIGFSKVILSGIDGEINDQQRTDLTVIHNDGVHLLGVINDILDLTKIEAGHMELQAEIMDLGSTIEDVARTAAGLLGDKPIELRVELEDDLPSIWADRMRVRQILLNLVSNAIKFTDEGSVKISASARPQEVLVAVNDTGRGMKPEEIPVAFSEFRQLDNTPGRRAGGTGLGLTITSSLVAMHGGRIWVSSEPGVGSTFYFTLPIKPTEAEGVDQGNIN